MDNNSSNDPFGASPPCLLRVTPSHLDAGSRSTSAGTSMTTRYFPQNFSSSHPPAGSRVAYGSRSASSSITNKVLSSPVDVRLNTKRSSSVTLKQLILGTLFFISVALNLHFISFITNGVRNEHSTTDVEDSESNLLFFAMHNTSTDKTTPNRRPPTLQNHEMSPVVDKDEEADVGAIEQHMIFQARLRDRMRRRGNYTTRPRRQFSLYGEDRENRFARSRNYVVAPPPKVKVPDWLVNVSKFAYSVKLKANEVLKSKTVNGDPPLKVAVCEASDTNQTSAEPNYLQHYPVVDCQQLSEEFRLNCFNKGQELPEVNRSDGYEKGYLYVPGLTDPKVVLVALYNEHRRANMQNDEPMFPLAGVEAYTELPLAPGATSISYSTQPMVIDIVYTYVDGNEETFLTDIQKYTQTFGGAKTDPLEEPNPLGADKDNGGGKITGGLVNAFTSVWEAMLRVYPKLALTSQGVANSLQNYTTGADVDDEEAQRYLEEKLKDISGEIDQLKTQKITMEEHALHFIRNEAEPEGNRYRDFREFAFSLRSIFRHIITPMEKRLDVFMPEGVPKMHNSNFGGNVKFSRRFGKIYIIVSKKQQIPQWLNVSDPTFVVVEHAELFPDPDMSLPTFNSYAIETVIHRIPNLSRHYLYLNNDMIIARPPSFFDFFQPVVVGSEVRFMPAIHVGFVKKYICKSSQKYKGGRMCIPKAFGLHHETLLDNMALMAEVMKSNEPPFTLTNVHMPIIYDKLIVLRMMSEPVLQPHVCKTRTSRKRLLSNVYMNFMYTFFSLWTRHDRDRNALSDYVLSGGTNSAEAINRFKAMKDGIGRRFYTMWMYLVLNPTENGNSVAVDPMFADHTTFIFSTLQKGLVTGSMGFVSNIPVTDIISVDGLTGAITPVEPKIAQEKISRSKNKFGSTNHWLYDVITLLADAAMDQEPSIRYYFGMMSGKASGTRYLSDVRPRIGRLLAATFNDDFPSVRDVPHPLLNLSSLLVGSVCNTYSDRKLFSILTSIRASMEDVSLRYEFASSGQETLEAALIRNQFTASLQSQIGLEGIIDNRPANVVRQRGLLNDNNNLIFTSRLLNRLKASCRVASAYQSLTAVRQAVGKLPFDRKRLNYDSSNPKAGIYGAENLKEAFRIGSEGGPNSPFRTLIPQWEIPMAE